MESPDGGFSAFLARQIGEEKAGEMLSGFSKISMARHTRFIGSSKTCR
jgi:hypothetical protein